MIKKILSQNFLLVNLEPKLIRHVVACSGHGSQDHNPSFQSFFHQSGNIDPTSEVIQLEKIILIKIWEFFFSFGGL